MRIAWCRRKRPPQQIRSYAPKYFSAHAYKTLQALCQTIIPSDDDAKGAIEAGAPEFIDLITSENQDYQLALGGGMMWLDNTCIDRYGKVYLDCAPAQQKEILDLIAYRKNAKQDPEPRPGHRILRTFAQAYRRRIFHQRNRNRVSRLHRQHILERISRLPACPRPVEQLSEGIM